MLNGKNICLLAKETTSICKLQFGDKKIKHVQKFKYLGSDLTEHGKCDTEMWRHIAFQKLSKVKRQGKLISLETKDYWTVM